jgi:ATP-dependent RNA helicase DeaD
MSHFSLTGLSPQLLATVAELGYTKPTGIQELVIPHALMQPESDFIALAQTGTGKTAAFGLPLADLVDFDRKETQALILSPTRELALQITNDLTAFCAGNKKAHIVTVYGGAGIQDQIRQLKRGPQIVVATPGRLIDFINRRAIDLSLVKFVILDEADEMLNMGFRDDIEDILKSVPEERNVWLFSATMPKQIEQIAKRYMRNPAKFAAAKQNTTALNLTHDYFLVDGRQKYPVLKRLLDSEPDIYAIVFCQTKNDTRVVAEHLVKDGYNAEALHGDLSQSQRESVMNKFRQRVVTILVATDVAARGIDVDSVSHVIHYSLPDEFENYTHRSGRTARAGRSGKAIALVAHKEQYTIRHLEKELGLKMNKIPIPSGIDVLQNKIQTFKTRIEETVVTEAIVKAIEDNGLMETDVLKLLAFLFKKENIDLEMKDDRDLNHIKDSRDSREPMMPGGQFVPVYIGLGKHNNMNAGRIMKLVCDKAGVPRTGIGRIRLFHDHAEVGISENLLEKAMDKLRKTKWDDRPFKVKPYAK